jgi:hypothetical protein
MDITGAGSASPIAYLSGMGLSAATDKVEVTAFEDDNKVKLAGKPDASGTFKGWYDNATAQTYTAAIDGVARKFYFYPNASVGTTGPYWFGTAFFDFQIEVDVAGAVSFSGSWEAASNVTKVG